MGATYLVMASDETLLAAVAAGDEPALRVLYERHAPVMLALIRRLSSDRGVAEDILQEAWLAVWHSAGTFRGESSARGWLFGVTRRCAHDRLRRKTLSQVELDDAATVPEPGADVEATVLAAAGLDRIQAAIGALPEPLGETVLLALVHDLAYRDIATALDIPLGTVKSRMSLARRRLAAALTEDYDADEQVQR